MDARIAYNDTGKYFDLVMSGAGLETDEGLETAVLISLFTDRKAEETDEIPDGTDDRRGWWGDAFSSIDGDRIGSRRWLLGRSKQTEEVARRAATYDEEALAWMVDDGIAAAVSVSAEWIATGVLTEEVKITRPDGTTLTFVYDNLWEAMNGV